MTTRTPPAVRRQGQRAPPSPGGPEARLLQLMEQGAEGQQPPRLLSVSKEEERRRVREQTLRALSLLGHGPQTLLAARGLLEEVVEALSPATLPTFLSAVLATGEAHTGDGHASSLAQRECVRVLGEVVALHGGLCGRYYGPVVEYVVRRLLGEAQQRGRSTFASPTPGGASPAAARSGSTEKMQLQCAESLQLVVNSLPPPLYPLRTVVDPLLELFSKRHSLAAPYTQHCQQGAAECLEAVLYAEAVSSYLAGVGGDGTDGTDAEAAGEQGRRELRALVRRVLLLLRPRSRCLHAPLLRLLATTMRETDAVTAVGDQLQELMARAVQALSAVPGAGHLYAGAANPALQAEYWRTRQEAANLLSACATLLPRTLSAPYAKEVLHYLSQCKHDQVRPVRDAVAGAIASWERIRQYLDDLQKPGRLVKPRLAYGQRKGGTSGGAKAPGRQVESKASPRGGKEPTRKGSAAERQPAKRRDSLRQFIQTRRQSLRGTGASPVPDHVVLVPRSAPPERRRDVCVRDKDEHGSLQRWMEEEEEELEEEVRVDPERDDDEWLSQADYQGQRWPHSSPLAQERPIQAPAGASGSDVYGQLSPAVRALAPTGQVPLPFSPIAGHGWGGTVTNSPSSPTVQALMQDIAAINFQLKTLYQRQISLVDSIAQDRRTPPNTGGTELQQQQRELKALQQQVQQLIGKKNSLQGSGHLTPLAVDSSLAERSSGHAASLVDWLGKLAGSNVPEAFLSLLSDTSPEVVASLNDGAVRKLLDVLLTLLEDGCECELARRWLCALLSSKLPVTEQQIQRLAMRLH